MNYNFNSRSYLSWSYMLVHRTVITPNQTHSLWMIQQLSGPYGNSHKCYILLGVWWFLYKWMPLALQHQRTPLHTDSEEEFPNPPRIEWVASALLVCLCKNRILQLYLIFREWIITKSLFNNTIQYNIIHCVVSEDLWIYCSVQIIWITLMLYIPFL